MNRSAVLTLCVAAAAVLAVLLARVALDESRQTNDGRPATGDVGPKRPAGHPAGAGSRVSVRDGEVVIELDAAAQRAGALAAATPEPVVRRQEARGFATVLDLAPLADNLAGMLQARALADKAEAALAASHAEYERTRLLNLDGKNASDRALQLARAALRADEATARGARDSLRMLEAGAYQRWGSVIGRWIAQDDAALAPLLRQQDVLLQVALPAADGSSLQVMLPPAVRVALPGARFAQAQLVSPAPRADPRVQGLTAFYRAPADIGLTPGLNVAVFLPRPDAAQGVVVPLAAIVWWQGRAWVYAQLDEEHFARREVPVDTPVAGGYFVADANRFGKRIVTRGAQALLSEELRAQIRIEDDDRDGDRQ